MSGSKFKKQRRGQKKAVDLDITSLLDIITILLVFLLQSYNVTDLKLDLVSGITVPSSNAKDLGSHAVIIQVNKDLQIYLNNKHIGNAVGTDEKIPFLYDELLNYKKENKLEEISRDIASIQKTDDKKTKLKANLVFDKNISYKAMRQIMHTSALAGFGEFKFIVQANY